MQLIWTIAIIALVINQCLGVKKFEELNEEDQVGALEIKVFTAGIENLGQLREVPQNQKATYDKLVPCEEDGGIKVGTNLFQSFGLVTLARFLDKDIFHAMLLPFFAKDLEPHGLPQLADFSDDHKQMNAQHFHMNPDKNAVSATALNQKLVQFAEAGTNTDIIHNIPETAGKIEGDNLLEFLVGYLGGIDILDTKKAVFTSVEALKKRIEESGLLTKMANHRPGLIR